MNKKTAYGLRRLSVSRLLLSGFGFTLAVPSSTIPPRSLVLNNEAYEYGERYNAKVYDERILFHCQSF